MAAAAAAEAGEVSSNEHGEDEEGIMRAAYSFFWQSIGAMTPYLVALIMVAAWGTANSNTTAVQATLLFALGAVPASIVLWASYRSGAVEKAASSNSNGTPSSRPSRPLAAFSEHPEYAFYLVGTGGTWCA